MFLFLLIVQTLVAVGLITVILMQRSEGGGLTGGGSPSGLMTARGAADFLTRATSILGGIFVVLSIVLAALAAQTAGRTIDVNAAQEAPTSGGQLPSAQPPVAPAPGQPGSSAIPTLPPAQQPAPGAQGAPAAIPTLSPQKAPAQGNQGVPIAQ